MQLEQFLSMHIMLHIHPNVQVTVTKVATVLVRINMGFRKPMDYNAVNHQIYMTGVELNSHRNDGFTALELKKDLYKIKWLVDSILKDSPNFGSSETEFIKECEQENMWNILKR